MNKTMNVLLIDVASPNVVRLKEMVNRLGYDSCLIAKPEVTIVQLQTLEPGLAILGPALQAQISTGRAKNSSRSHFWAFIT